MLLSDGFGGFGGIAKFNRDFLGALNASRHIEHIYVLPRSIPEPIIAGIPEAVIYDRQSAAGKASYLFRTLRYLMRGARPHFVVCGHRNLLPAAWLLARLRRARLVLVIHGIEAWKPSPSALANWAAKRIDALISVSRVTAERFCAWANTPMELTFILPNCVDLDRFTPRPKNSALLAKYALDGSRVIATLGRIAANEPSKGFDQAIDAMPRLLARYPDLKYLIVGEGLDRPRLEAKVAALNLTGHVIFAGHVPAADIVDYYNLADAYVMPSAGEGFGIVLIEAAACGVPVIGSSQDGSREALLNGRLGQLVDPSDADALVSAIAVALDGGGKGHRLSGIETFSDERFVARVAAWAETICAQIHARPGHAR